MVFHRALSLSLHGALFFLIYVNDLAGMSSYMLVSADDAKLMRVRTV